MSPERLAELRNLAEAANEPQPWFGSDEVEQLIRGTPDDGEFIAAFNPATALELLDEITDAREVIRVLSEALRFYRRADNWITKSNEPCSPIVADTGSTASKALESTREKRENI